MISRDSTAASLCSCACADPEKNCQRGSNFDISLVDEVGRIQIPLYNKRAIIGPPVKRDLNGVSLAC